MNRPIPSVQVDQDFREVEAALFGSSTSTIGKGFADGYLARKEKISTLNPTSNEGRAYQDRLRAKTDMYAEDPDRRRAWSFLFENHPDSKVADRYKGGKNNLIRIQTERALDNSYQYALGWIQSQRLEGTFCMNCGVSSLGKISPEQLYKASIESATITKFPGQLLNLTRTLMPKLISRQIFSFRQVETPNARVPVLSVTYGADLDPYELGGDVFHQVQGATGTVFNPYYGGGQHLNVNIGTGDGATLNFDLPVSEVEVSSIEVYEDGVLAVRGTDYTISAGAGANGEDRVVFGGGNAPANAVEVTANFNTSLGRGEKGRLLNTTISNVTLTDDSIKLTTEWTHEDEQDADAFNNLVLGNEFEAVMAQTIEIQLEALVINNAFRGATGGNHIFDSTAFEPDDALTSQGKFYYNKRIVEAVTGACEDLWERFGRQPNYCIVGNNIATHLQNLTPFRAITSAELGMMQMERFEGGQILGEWGNGIMFYRSNYAPADKALFGWSPENAYDTQILVGIFRLYDTGIVQDGDADFIKRSSRALRYGFADVKPLQRTTLTYT